jgi:enoyl-CoA hydratase/carnithine racemase
MAKHFRTILSSGHEISAARNQPHEARAIVNYDDRQRFFLAGADVSAAAFYAEAQSLCDAWLEAKERTHKLVRLRHGSSAACFVWKWVPR